MTDVTGCCLHCQAGRVCIADFELDKTCCSRMVVVSDVASSQYIAAIWYGNDEAQERY